MRDAKDIKRLRGMDFLTYKHMAENPNPPKVEREAFIIKQMRKTKEIMNERKKATHTE